MNIVDLKFTGAVLNLKIELEGIEIGLYFDGVSEWTRTIKDFVIDGKLDLFLLCKGINGTKWTLEIMVNGRGPQKYSGIVAKGYSEVNDQIEIPLK